MIDAVVSWIMTHMIDASVYAGCIALILLGVLLYMNREDW